MTAGGVQTCRRSGAWHVLVAALFAAGPILLPCLSAVAQVSQPGFAVATVKAAPGADPDTGSWSPPGKGSFFATHVTLALLLQLAYGVDGSQIVNKPGWVDTALWDVQGKPEEGVLLSRDELKPRLQELLKQRFHLREHTEMRPSRGFALIPAKGGPHLSPTRSEHFPGYRIRVGPGEMRGANWSMPIFARYLTSVAGFPVVDFTGITGSYDISFSYATEQQSEDAGNTLPSLGEALRKATGLALKSQLVPVETVVIDSVERAAADD